MRPQCCDTTAGSAAYILRSIVFVSQQAGGHIQAHLRSIYCPLEKQRNWWLLPKEPQQRQLMRLAPSSQPGASDERLLTTCLGAGGTLLGPDSSRNWLCSGICYIKDASLSSTLGRLRMRSQHSNCRAPLSCLLGAKHDECRHLQSCSASHQCSGRRMVLAQKGSVHSHISGKHTAALEPQCHGTFLRDVCRGAEQRLSPLHHC